MGPVADVLPPLTVGVMFTGFAALKFYGLARGIEGGGKKPLATRLCGS